MSTSAQHAPVPAKPKRRWRQYGLGSMFVVVTALCVVLGIVSRQAERQRQAVAAIHDLGGDVQYSDFPWFNVPTWLREVLGEDYFRTACFVSLNTRGNEDAAAGILAAGNVQFLEYLPTVTTLDLDGTNVGDADLTALRGLTHLDRLGLAGTQVGDTGLRRLAGLRLLTRLDVSDTWVTDEGVAHLARLRTLTRLDLSNTQVTDAGVAELQKALPNCVIRHWRRPR